MAFQQPRSEPAPSPSLHLRQALLLDADARSSQDPSRPSVCKHPFPGPVELEYSEYAQILNKDKSEVREIPKQDENASTASVASEKS